MSYIPTEWKTGDVITADKLNNMESGIANGGSGGSTAIIATITPAPDDELYEYKCDKTFDELVQALEGGKQVYFKLPNSTTLIGVTSFGELDVTATYVYVQKKDNTTLTITSYDVVFNSGSEVDYHRISATVNATFI